MYGVHDSGTKEGGRISLTRVTATTQPFGIGNNVHDITTRVLETPSSG